MDVKNKQWHAAGMLNGMTPDEKAPAERTLDTPWREGEVVISGLDTGPSNAEREAPTPTERSERLLPTHPTSEPTDEDG